MPPKVKITRGDIVSTAVNLVRKNGVEGLNARAVAQALNCSTQPVFSNFAKMEDLTIATLESAYGVYLDFIKAEVESGKYPEYKAFGMAYVRFAREEKELFKFLFMCDRTGKEIAPAPDFEAAIELIMKANGISRKSAELMHLEMWTCVHGIGTMIATSFLPLDLTLVSNILSDVYQGLRTKHLEENN